MLHLGQAEGLEVSERTVLRALEVLALGPDVEVVAPAELRDHVSGLARRTAALYDS